MQQHQNLELVQRPVSVCVRRGGGFVGPGYQTPKNAAVRTMSVAFFFPLCVWQACWGRC
jgi:hypothetical protein